MSNMVDAGKRPPDTRRAWSNLWATGVADTFGHPGGHEGSAPPLAQIWQEWFGTLPPRASVLDIGTGNGALALLMLRSAATKTTCDAIDLAQLSPRWIDSQPATQRARVRFHSGVDCAELPFPSQSFDAVCSQFGIEYAGMALALPEALRVLRPNGQLRLALHAENARPARLAREELTHAQWLSDCGWWEASRDMARAMSLLSTPDGARRLNAESQWQGVRQRFDALSQQLAERMRSSLCPDLLMDAQGWTVQVFQQAAARGWTAAESALMQVAVLMEDGQTRLHDLLAHTSTEDDVARAVRLIEASGHRARMEPAVDRGHTMGWWLLAG